MNRRVSVTAREHDGTADVIVVGAGPSGVASALALKDAGVRALVLDRADQVAEAWRGRYDRLRLNTSRRLSHLPDRPFAEGTPMFPTRDQLVGHIEQCAAEDGLELRFGTTVEEVARDDSGWRVSTTNADLHAVQVIIATGYENQPMIPDWPGCDAYPGRLLHSSQYRNPRPFQGQSVLVVGPGSSGMEIAHDLARGGAAKAWLAVRTPPNILLREGPAGIPGDMIGVVMLHLPTRAADALARFARRMSIGDLSEYGLPVPEEGPMTRLHRLGVAPAIVDKEIIEAIKTGAIAIVPGVQGFTGRSVCLAGGSTIEPDAVICATGYSRGLESLVGGLDVLDEQGRPRAVGAHPAAPGLRFIGYVPRPAGLGYMAKQAKRAAKAIARELRDHH
jgi:NADPH-dependent 2,4-dienoyl-CoA reductase/sulfur reductase-like enzyme